MVESDRIDWDFGYHRPLSERATRHEAVRDECKKLAHYLNDICPDGREKSFAIMHAEEAMFWANAAIARAKNDE